MSAHTGYFRDSSAVCQQAGRLLQTVCWSEPARASLLQRNTATMQTIQSMCSERTQGSSLWRQLKASVYEIRFRTDCSSFVILWNICMFNFSGSTPGPSHSWTHEHTTANEPSHAHALSCPAWFKKTLVSTLEPFPRLYYWRTSITLKWRLVMLCTWTETAYKMHLHHPLVVGCCKTINKNILFQWHFLEKISFFQCMFKCTGS